MTTLFKLEHAITPRVVELADRLVAPGTKASQISASECHEIADAIKAAAKALTEPILDCGYIDREFLGKMARDEYVMSQAHPKEFKSWDELSEEEKEVNRRIGERLYKFGKFLEWDMTQRKGNDDRRRPD
jgi:hypothetical protein